MLVLIETSWNVKVQGQSQLRDAVIVLIETSWNVKGILERVKYGGSTGINRNIVECKDTLVIRDSADVKY